MIIVFFLIVFVVMTPISIYLLITQRESRLLVWGALIIFTGGLSGLQVLLEKLVLPYMQSADASAIWQISLYVVTAFLNIIIHTFPYYLILVFFMHYAGYSESIVIGLLLVPALLSFLFSDIFPTPRMNYSYILSWGVPYLLISIMLFAKGFLKVEKVRRKQLQYVGFGIIFLIPVFLLLLLQLEGIYFQSPVEILIFIPILGLISLLLGLIFYVHKVYTHFESVTVLNKMQVGTSLMQHAFKNAITKNKLHALNIQRSLESNQYEIINNQLTSLLKSNDHLMGMVSKLSYLTQSRITLDLESSDLSLVLDEAIDQFHQTSITFEKRYGSAIVQIDRTLMAECFSNIISNAVEAMEGRGQITVAAEKINRHVSIQFTDTGRGMNKEQLDKIFEPFYSTKHKSGQNFGLGMFHVKKIVNAHRGKVKVTSQLGKGTTVTLILS
ncbi:HAMP domain-containing sensor histidine kinase [Paenibacillus sp. 1011MAR3C5]|uniref:sensor histidine kinase n=1 Tax=Paenibacillus sp. 1011MAR3C5 TaxID=1675787 RepID=UPI001603B22E|nr:HAMP domain-containing sensor histidine kinase [Paenibacillus sp. 1011MAR3C5]